MRIGTQVGIHATLEVSVECASVEMGMLECFLTGLQKLADIEFVYLLRDLEISDEAGLAEVRVVLSDSAFAMSRNEPIIGFKVDEVRTGSLDLILSIEQFFLYMRFAAPFLGDVAKNVLSDMVVDIGKFWLGRARIAKRSALPENHDKYRADAARHLKIWAKEMARFADSAQSVTFSCMHGDDLVIESTIEFSQLASKEPEYFLPAVSNLIRVRNLGPKAQVAAGYLSGVSSALKADILEGRSAITVECSEMELEDIRSILGALEVDFEVLGPERRKPKA